MRENAQHRAFVKSLNGLAQAGHLDEQDRTTLAKQIFAMLKCRMVDLPHFDQANDFHVLTDLHSVFRADASDSDSTKALRIEHATLLSKLINFEKWDTGTPQAAVDLIPELLRHSDISFAARNEIQQRLTEGDRIRAEAQRLSAAPPPPSSPRIGSGVTATGEHSPVPGAATPPLQVSLPARTSVSDGVGTISTPKRSRRIAAIACASALAVSIAFVCYVAVNMNVNSKRT